MSGGSTTKAPGKGTLAPPSAAPQRDVKGEDQTNKPTQPDLDVREDAAGVVIRVRAKPRASRSRVVGCTEGALDVAIAAPPVDGAANDELMRTLAAHFGLPRRCVMLIAGESSRHKRVHLAGLKAADVSAKTPSSVKR